MKWVVTAALVALSMACQSASDAPKDPVWGKQACSSCAMLVSDPHFAAQVLTPAGDHMYFDDVGCMASFLARRKSTADRAWVRDPSGNWVTSELAHFSAGAKTPMDYGFEFSATGPLEWDVVQSAVRERLAKGDER
jgi:copper chaperone NosL